MCIMHVWSETKQYSSNLASDAYELMSYIKFYYVCELFHSYDVTYNKYIYNLY